MNDTRRNGQPFGTGLAGNPFSSRRQENLQPQSSSEQIKDASDAIFDLLSDYLFDRVNLLNFPGQSTSTGVTSTTTFGGLLRVPDTALGRYLKVDRRSRLRTIFYITGDSDRAECYILSPAVYQDTASLNTFTTIDVLEAYVGIKIDDTVVSLVSKGVGGAKEQQTTATIIDDETHVLDIIYNITYADVYLDNVFLGSINCDLTSTLYNPVTVFPLFAPIRSNSGNSVSLVAENYQFLQDR